MDQMGDLHRILFRTASARGRGKADAEPRGLRWGQLIPMDHVLVDRDAGFLQTDLGFLAGKAIGL